MSGIRAGVGMLMPHVAVTNVRCNLRLMSLSVLSECSMLDMRIALCTFNERGEEYHG